MIAKNGQKMTVIHFFLQIIQFWLILNMSTYFGAQKQNTKTKKAQHLILAIFGYNMTKEGLLWS